MKSSRDPRIGLVLLNTAAAECVPRIDRKGASIASKVPWVCMDQNFFGVSVVGAVAPNSEPDSMLAGGEPVIRGIMSAANKLDGATDLIIGNCGFMWGVSNGMRRATMTPTILSGLDFLELALNMTRGDVGIVTFSERALNRLLVGHPDGDRIRVVGLDDLPDWRALGEGEDVTSDSWSMKGLREQLIARLGTALAEGGALRDVRLLILECAALPNFRSDMRSITPLPILDVASFAAAAIA